MKYISIGGRTAVNPNEVVLLVAAINYTIIHFADGKKDIVATPLKTLESRFSPFQFYRTHKSFMVNLNHITGYQNKKRILEMSNNQVVIVSRRKKQGLKEFLIDR